MEAFKKILLILAALPFFLEAANTGNDIQTKKAVLSNTARITPEPFLLVVEGQLDALRKGDLDRAYYDFTSEEFRKNTSFEEFKTLINNFEGLAKNRKFQFQSFYVEEDIATLEGDILQETGAPIPVEYDFVQQDGKWKILGIQIYRNEQTTIPSLQSKK